MALSAPEQDLGRMTREFLRDCRARDLSPFTVAYYERELRFFGNFCQERGLADIRAIRAADLRGYLEHLENERKRNPGGRHAAYRAVRRFLRWWEAEVEPAEWKNPITKVQPPKVAQEPIRGIEPAEVKRILDAIPNSPLGLRDTAIVLTLFDCAPRKRELLSLDRGDVDTFSGTVTIRRGKGGMGRAVFIGRKTRRAIRAYLRSRTDTNAALWVNLAGERLTVSGLEHVLIKWANAAGISPPPSAHDYRRGCAIQLLRSGVSVFHIQRILGHSDLTVLRAYLALADEDIRLAHSQASPSDHV
jgi:site-specific recombinase XerD